LPPTAEDDAPYLRHHVSSVRIFVDSPTRARADAYSIVLTPRGPDHSGRYRDRAVLEGGRWRFALR
jgi:hypothetical protein